MAQTLPRNNSVHDVSRIVGNRFLQFVIELEKVGNVLEDILAERIDVEIRLQRPHAAKSVLLGGVEVRAVAVHTYPRTVAWRIKMQQRRDKLRHSGILFRVLSRKTIQKVPGHLDAEFAAPLQA